MTIEEEVSGTGTNHQQDSEALQNKKKREKESKEEGKKATKE